MVKKIDKLTVLSLNSKKKESDDGYEYFYNCICDCGREVIRGTQSLRSKSSKKSCTKCPKIIEETILYKYPNMIKYFKNKKDLYNYKCGSHDKIETICDNCGNKRYMEVKSLLTNGFNCNICSDFISYPEKFIISFLKQSNLDFEREVIFDWAKNKRYDFYIPSLNCIIETHGIQHYENTSRKRTRNLNEEKENDDLKEFLAKENGISEYIILDCRESTIEQMLKSIYSSRLIYIIDFIKINFNKCQEYAVSNMVKEACNIWNKTDKKSTKEISKILKISSACASKYLKIGNELGWCEYDARLSTSMYRDNSRFTEMNKTKVRFIEENKEFNSVKECCEYIEEKFKIKFIYSGISQVCSGKRKHYKGYHFEYIT